MMFRKPAYVPSFLLHVCLYDQCKDCKRWGHWREMSDINPDVCRDCLAVRMIDGIVAESQFRMQLQMVTMAMQYAASYYKGRAEIEEIDRQRRDRKMEECKFLLLMGKYDEASKALQEAIRK